MDASAYRPRQINGKRVVSPEYHYEKSNCEWATRKTQARNRSYCVLSDERIRAIVQLYNSRAWSQKMLGDLFGVSQSRVSQVLRQQCKM